MECQTFVSTDDGKEFAVDTLEHDGGLWLVPRWIGSPYPGMQRPLRIIRLESLPHDDLGDPSGTGVRRYRLRGTIPRDVIDGVSTRSQSGQQYDVREAPDLDVRRWP